MTTEPADRPRPRGALQLMFDPAFGVVFWGKLLAVVGVWTHSILAAIVVYSLTHSALMVGLVGAVQFVPQLILSPATGKWADSRNPHGQIVCGRLLCAAGSGSIAAFLAFAPELTGTAAATIIVMGSALVGIGFAVGGPTLQSIVPTLIRPGELATAMTLNSVPMTVGRVVGPAIGAFAAAHLGSAVGFAMAGALQIVLGLLIMLVRLPGPDASQSETDQRMRAAVRHVVRDRPMLLALVALTAVGFGSDPSITLAPSMAAELGGGTQLVGALSAACGVGASLGLAILALQRKQRSSPWITAWGLWLLGGGLVLTAAATIPEVALAGFCVAGVGFGWALTGLGTLIQERAPDALRGRIMALWLVCFLGARPLAATILGITADVVTVHVAFLIAGAVTVAVAIVCRPRALAGVEGTGRRVVCVGH